MGKATVGLVGGYWPDNVFRYVAPPRWTLDEGLVERPTRQWGDQAALALGPRVISFRQLHEDVERVGSALQGVLEPGARVGLYLGSPIGLLTGFLGALRGGYVTYLMDTSAPYDRLRPALTGFRADLLMCDEVTEERGKRLARGIPIASYEGLQPTGAPRRKVRVDVQAASVALCDEAGRLLFHSHHSLLAGAISWSTFITLGSGQAVLCTRPMYTWEGLYSVMAALFRGSLCLLADIGDPALGAHIQQYRPAYAIVNPEELDELVADGGLARAIDNTMMGIFVSLAHPFSARWRRRARNRLRTEVLTAYGSSRLGAVIASHPSWYEDSALGIPVTNVDLWPLDPTTKEALDVSWEAIEYAEIGVRSPMIAPSGLEGDKRWVPTGLLATMDPNGFYYLLERPGEWLQRLGLAIPVLDTTAFPGGRPPPAEVPTEPPRPYEPPTASLRSQLQSLLHQRALQDIAGVRFSFPTTSYRYYKTYLNHPQRTMGVSMPTGSVAYPDIVVVEQPENYTKIVAQVETAERVNEDVAYHEWRPYAELAPLYLYVPVSKGEEALRLCRKLGIPVVGIRTWRYAVGYDQIEINDYYDI